MRIRHFIVLFLKIFERFFPATCNDGIKNQGEIGVDCGGPCTTECPGMRNRDIL